MSPDRSPIAKGFDKFARVTTKWAGSTAGFVIAVLVVLAWAGTGPVFHYSDTWQLVINTGTTIVTFLMVFLIQRSQNRDSAAVQLKLDELIAAAKGASNRLIGIEELAEDDINRLRESFQKLAALAKDDARCGRSHSVDEVADQAEEALANVEKVTEALAGQAPDAP